MFHTLTTQADLDSLISDLRDSGYPYLGSDDCTWTLLPDGRIEWQAQAPYPFGTDKEDWHSIQTQDEFHESIQAWRHDY